MKSFKKIALIILLISTQLLAQKNSSDSMWNRFSKSNSDTQKVNTLNKLFQLYSVSNSDSALKIAQMALKLAYRSKYILGKSASYNNIGTIYYFNGNNTRALTSYLASLKILESEEDLAKTNVHYKIQISSAYNNIGAIYQRQKLRSKAEYYFRKSIALDSIIGNKSSMAHSYNNIGTLKEEVNKYDEAIANYEWALKLKKEMHDTMGIASTLINMGVVRMNQNKFIEAEKYYSLALIMSQRQNDKADEALALINMGDNCYLQKDYNPSIKYYMLGIKVCEKQGYQQFLSYALNSLSLSYYRLKDFKSAYEINQKYIAIRDSMYSKENSKVLSEMQTKYDSEAQAKEIKLLLSEKEINDLELNRKRILIYVFIGGLLVLAILVLGAIYAYRQKHKANTTLADKNEKIELAYKIIEEKQKEIVDSINYAKRIQYTLLAHAEFLKENIPNNFVYFEPKDIVSGDFYWATKKDNKFYLAVCDSTGHGVPGAFMSLLSIGFLSEAINEKGIEKPNDVFNYVRQRLIDNISKEDQKDGFDGILICIDQKTKHITYSAANNKPILIQEEQIKELESDRMPVGIGERKDEFNLYTIKAKAGDALYLYTDGYSDQFGGPNGKKYKSKTLNELLLLQSKNSLEQQSKVLSENFENWRGNLEQVDDVCIIGIKL
ncbi:MAG: tetratricopeptide repeat protein [Bacteroidota bacterium]|nr:tetratricopeptide repeat protein [Bacteroidota bacterium]